MSYIQALNAAIADRCSTMSDAEVADLIIATDKQLDAITDKASDDAGALRMVRGSLLTVLETRYPWLDEILEAWVMDDADDREYAQVVFDALNAEMVLA